MKIYTFYSVLFEIILLMRRNFSLGTLICYVPPVLKNGYILPRNKMIFSIGEMVEFKCNPPLQLVGNQISTCLGSGQFAGFSNRCVSNGTTFCPLPEIPFGGRIDSKSQARYIPGDIIRYSCQIEFYLAGSSQLTCQTDGTYSHPFPSCLIYFPSPFQAVTTCSRLRIPKNGNVLPEGKSTWLPGEKATLNCENPFLLIGDRFATCLKNGSFSFTATWCIEPVTVSTRPAPLLVVPCLRPVVQEHQRIDEDPDKQIWYSGEKLRFSCDVGYTLTGSSEVFCSPDGSFNNVLPLCLAEENNSGCSIALPDHIRNVGNKGDGIPLNTVAKFYCDDGFQIVGNDTIYCQSGGTLSQSLPVCTVCSPTPPANGYLYPEDKRIWLENELILYRCKPGFIMIGLGLNFCQSYQEILGEVPHCVENLDFHNSCEASQPVNGYSLPKGTNQYPNLVGFEYECEDGYYLIGEPVNICINGFLAFDVPKCQGSLS